MLYNEVMGVVGGDEEKAFFAKERRSSVSLRLSVLPRGETNLLSTY